MRKFLAALAFLALSCVPAMAAFQPGAVVQLPNVAALRGGNYVNTPQVQLGGYYALGDGGGGNVASATCTPDNALCFADSAGNTFKRTDFGTKGVVDARQCGVKGIGLANDDYAALNTCLLLANALGLPTVSTGGGQVYDNTANIVIPENVTLDCGLGNPSSSMPNNDFTLASGFTHVIAFPSTYTIKPGTLGNAALMNCQLERAGGPYSPTTFVPATLRDSLNGRAAFAGVAVTNGSKSFTVQNVYAYGFATCFQSVLGNNRARWFGSGGHCDMGMDMGPNGDVLPVQTMNFLPFLYRVNGTASQNQWQIDNMKNDGSGRYRVVAEIPTSGPGSITILANDQFAYQAPAGDGVQSAASVWLAGTPAVISSGTDGCLVATCQEFTLLGALGNPDSQDSQPSDGSPISVSASWVVGAQGNAITVTAGVMANISVGQTVAQVGGCGAIPGGTVVQDIPSPSQNIVYLSAALTCGSSGTLTFADTNFVYDPGPKQDVVISAVHNNGDCIRLTATSGFKAVNVHCFGHNVAFHCYEQAGNFSILNGDTGSDEKYFDPHVIGFLGDGKHVGQDCSGGTFTSGILTQHATVGIVINSDSNAGAAPFEFASVEDGPSTGNRVGMILDDEAGKALLNTSYGQTKGNVFISAGTTFRNLYPAKTDASVNYQVGNILTGNDGGCSVQPQVTVTSVNGGVLDPEGLTQTRAGVCSVWPSTFTGATLTCANGTGSGCGTGAVLTTDGLILADATIDGSLFPQGDLYPQDQFTATNHVRGCGDAPFLSALYSPLGPCIGGAAAVTPASVASVSALLSGNLTGIQTVNLQAYFAGTNIGGGLLTAQSCTVDNGLCFRDSIGNTFRRQSPLWDLSEWGAAGDGATDNSAKTQAFLNAAKAAGVLTPKISLSGQYYNATGFTIPAQVTLLCTSGRTDQAVNTSGVVSGDHKSYPYLILIPSSATVTLSSQGPSGTMSGCNVENKAVYDTPNPTTLQSLYTITAAFGGTGVTCGGVGCKYEKGQILGFTNGFVDTNFDTPQLNEAYIDATNCVNISSASFNAGNGNNFGCYPNLTSRLTNSFLHLPIATIEDSPTTPGRYRMILSAACVDSTGNCPRTGNSVWIGLPANNAQPVGAESLAGLCTFLRIDDSNYECTNSQSTATVTSGTTIQGSFVVTGVTNMTHIRIGQTATCTGCGASATVVEVAPRMNSVKLSVAATASGTIANMTFTDNAFSGADLYNVRPFPNFRFGNGLVLDGDHNQKFSSSLVTNHIIAYLLTDGAVDNTLLGCGAEDEQQNLDNSHIGIEFDLSSASNTMICGSIHYGANGSVGILNNQSSASNNTPNKVYVGAMGSQFLGDITLDDEGGNLDAEINTGTNNGSIVIADNIKSLTLTNSFANGDDLFYQSPVAQGRTSNGGNSFKSGTVPTRGTTVNSVTAHAGGGQTSATQTDTDFVRVNGVASDGDSVMLKPASVGITQTLTNSSGHTMQVYGYVATSDIINGIASATGVPQAPGSTVRYSSTANNAWSATLIPGQLPYTLSQSGAGFTAPADTTEDVLATITVLAGSLGANGCLVMETDWSYTGSTNSKTFKVRFGGIGGTAFLNTSTSTIGNVSSAFTTRICNANATNAQIGNPVNGTFASNSNAALPTGAIDTTSSTTVVITGQKASSGEALTLSAYSILEEPHV